MRSNLDACFARRPAGVEIALRLFQSIPLRPAGTKSSCIRDSLVYPPCTTMFLISISISQFWITRSSKKEQYSVLTGYAALARVALRSFQARIHLCYAQVVKLVDTLASGASDRKVVEVQVLFWAPFQPAVFYR